MYVVSKYNYVFILYVFDIDQFYFNIVDKMHISIMPILFCIYIHVLLKRISLDDQIPLLLL